MSRGAVLSALKLCICFSVGEGWLRQAALCALLSGLGLSGTALPNEDVVTFYLAREVLEEDHSGCLQPSHYMLTHTLGAVLVLLPDVGLPCCKQSGLLSLSSMLVHLGLVPCRDPI